MNSSHYEWIVEEFEYVPVRHYNGTLNELSDVIGYSHSSIFHSFESKRSFGEVFKVESREPKKHSKAFIYKVVEYEKKVANSWRGSVAEIATTLGINRYTIYSSYARGLKIHGKYEVRRIKL